ncbi:hypothetical protein BKA62DRAFT_768381 [Auriculariales sp. MPI-PUGE-AT-0066]|nr:hypothetical protein BKA62DRAFT_768381 [Auriculariales sp. MPI-PUGE-AT-0066]
MRIEFVERRDARFILLAAREGGSAPLGTGAIVGIALGCGLATFLVLGACVYVYMHWDHRRPRAVTSLSSQTQAVRGRSFPLASTTSLPLPDGTADDLGKNSWQSRSRREYVQGPGGREDDEGGAFRVSESLEPTSASGAVRILQHQFEPKPKKVQHQAKHARRSVLRRATQEEYSEDGHHSAGHGHAWPGSAHGHGRVADIGGLHDDAGSVNILEWTTGVTRIDALSSFGSAGLPISTSYAPAIQLFDRHQRSNPLGHSRADSTGPSGHSYARTGSSNLDAPTTQARVDRRRRDGASRRDEVEPSHDHVIPYTLQSATPLSSASEYPPEKARWMYPPSPAEGNSSGDALSPSYSIAASPYSPQSAAVSPHSAMTSPFSPPYSATSRTPLIDEKHRPPHNSRSQSRSRNDSNPGHSTSTRAHAVDLEPGAPAFLMTEPTTNLPFDDPTKRPGYDPKRGTVLPSYRAIIPGSSPP